MTFECFNWEWYYSYITINVMKYFSFLIVCIIVIKKDSILLPFLNWKNKVIRDKENIQRIWIYLFSYLTYNIGIIYIREKNITKPFYFSWGNMYIEIDIYIYMHYISWNHFINDHLNI